MSADHKDIVNSMIMDSDHWVYGYTRLDNGIIDHDDLDIFDKMVYIAIKRMINHQDQITFPSYEKIAQKAGCSRRKAIDVVKRLMELDLIENLGQHAQYGSNVYMIKRIQESKVLADPEKNRSSVVKKIGDVKPPIKARERPKEQAKDDHIPYKLIMDHLNEQAGTKFSHTGQANQKLIKARYNELKKAGLDHEQIIQEFKNAIDVKTSQWKDSDMAQYLRPSTLFGNKFDQYRNESPQTKAFNIQTGQASSDDRFSAFLNSDD